MSLDEIVKQIEEKPAVALYFSAPTCNVCHALKPKLFTALEENFQELEIISIDISQDQRTPAHYQVFAIPTLLVFLDGREFIRKTRHMSVDEVVAEIQRPYEIMFS
jgi:thioredoxin-like negative regulator of GroEL